VIVSSGWVIDPSDDLVEEFGSVGLSSFAGVVTLPGQDGQELDGGAEVGAGLAGRFHPAVELDRAGAQPVAERAGVRLAAQPGHAAGFVLGGQFGLLPVRASILALTAAYSSATTRLAMRA
jgi:hypothetical protein